MRSDTTTLVAALRILARDIHCEDGVATACISEGADRIEELQAEIKRTGRWILVSDQMPEEGVRCIIATRIPGRYVIDGQPQDGHEVEFGEWTGDRWKCFSIPCVSILHPSMVSHWLPMPPSPDALSPTTMPFAPEEDPDEEGGIWDSKKHKPD